MQFLDLSKDFWSFGPPTPLDELDPNSYVCTPYVFNTFKNYDKKAKYHSILPFLIPIYM